MNPKTIRIDKAFAKYAKALDEGIELAPTLGSCQYKSIEDTYNWVTEVLGIMGKAGFEKVLKITYHSIITKDELDGNLRYMLTEELKTQQKYLDDPDDDDEYAEEAIKTLKSLLTKPKITLEDWAEFSKGQSWDLWGSYFNPFVNMKINADITWTDNIDEDDNSYIGICLAYSTMLYDIDLSIWEGYDT